MYNTDLSAFVARGWDACRYVATGKGAEYTGLMWSSDLIKEALDKTETQADGSPVRADRIKQALADTIVMMVSDGFRMHARSQNATSNIGKKKSGFRTFTFTQGGPVYPGQNIR